MASLKAIADALAGRFTGVTATIGTETRQLDLITASLPDQLGMANALLVYHPIGVLDVGVSKLSKDLHDFPVRLLLDPQSYPERSDWLYAWYDVLRPRVEMDLDLGLSYVAWAHPISSRVALDEGSYALVDGYDLIEFIVRVRINEVVTTVSS